MQVRRVVTAVAGGRSVVSEDGPPKRRAGAPDGPGVADLLWLDAPPADLDAGGDFGGEGFPLEPPPGGLSCRMIRFPAPAASALSVPAAHEWIRVAGDDD